MARSCRPTRQASSAPRSRATPSASITPTALLHPLRRTGPKGSGSFARISWDEALDEIAARFDAAEREFGAESVWPYYYAGTMGLVMRDGINRLAHVKRYSRFYGTICSTIAWAGFAAGTGKVAGVDPREMAKSDLVVIWGTNAVSTQVNVMTHATKARKERGARIAVVDVYDNATMKQADIKIILRPGTDGAFACAVMHVLFRDGFADRAYLERYTDYPKELEAHLAIAHAGMGLGDLRRAGRRDRGLRPRRRRDEAQLLPARLRLHAEAATARSKCMRRSASPPSPAPGNMKGAAPSSTTARSGASRRR